MSRVIFNCPSVSLTLHVSCAFSSAHMHSFSQIDRIGISYLWCPPSNLLDFSCTVCCLYVCEAVVLFYSLIFFSCFPSMAALFKSNISTQHFFANLNELGIKLIGFAHIKPKETAIPPDDDGRWYISPLFFSVQPTLQEDGVFLCGKKKITEFRNVNTLMTSVSLKRSLFTFS